nr:MAG TPA: hypothetical protein [Caudoviricetes sp.]
MMAYLMRLSVKLCRTSSECHFNHIAYSAKLIRYVLTRGFCYVF